MENNKKLFTKKNIKQFMWINLGVILMAFAYAFFVDPHRLIIGGTSGLGTLFSHLEIFEKLNFRVFGENIGASEIIILILNGFLLIFALAFVGKKFFFNSIFVSFAYPVYSVFFSFLFNKFFKPYFVDIDMLNQIAETICNHNGDLNVSVIENALKAGPYLILIVFGSVISSIGIGLALKNGSSTGGVDILQKIFLDKFKIPFSVSLIMIDGSVVLLATICNNNIYILLYGVIYILISGIVVDMIVFNGFNSRAVNIITEYPEDIKEAVIKRFDRTVTEITAVGAYTGKERKLLVCVMGNSEFYQLKSLIAEIDPRAFIYTTRASEVHGEGFSFGEAPKANRKWKKK